MYHYIYKTTLLLGSLAGKYYYGKHSTQAKPENCGYAGSGVIVKDYFAKYGKVKGETYTIDIIELNQDKNTNAAREKEIIEPHLGHPMCLNIARGGFGGGVPGHQVSEETRLKLSKKLKGHKKFLPEGYHLSEEQKKKISESNKGKSRCKGRPSPMKGRKHTDETKAKISEKQKGKIMSEESKERIRAAYNPNRFIKGNEPWNKGVSQSEETRQKISEKLKGRTIPFAIVQKRAESQTGRKNSPEIIEKMRISKKNVWKAIISTNIETGEEKEFCSIADAERQLGINHSCIVGVLKGKNGRTQAGGYKFKYKDISAA